MRAGWCFVIAAGMIAPVASVDGVTARAEPAPDVVHSFGATAVLDSASAVPNGAEPTTSDPPDTQPPPTDPPDTQPPPTDPPDTQPELPAGAGAPDEPVIRAAPTCTVGREIGPSSQGAPVKCLQRHLLWRGETAVEVTGSWTVPTERAVKRFQRSVGLLTRPVGANAYTLWKMGIWAGSTPQFPCEVARAIGSWSSGRHVKCLQSRLIDRGDGAVRVTGTWTPETERAVKRFQRSVNLLTRPEGANRYTLWKLGIWSGSKVPAFSCSVKSGVGPGSTGRKVRCLQSRLIDRGDGTVVITGKWNAKTSRAVRRFERANALLTLGRATPTTLRALRIWSGNQNRPAKVGRANLPSYGAVYNVGPRQVALTFDDGPAIPYTSQMLSVLNKYEVPATFFVAGNAVSFGSDSLRAVARSGHSVQVHAWDHTAFTSLSDYSIGLQITRTSAAVKAATGKRTSCFRSPYGSTNTRVRAAAARVGHAPEILWNVDPQDWRRPAPSTLASHILSRADGRGLLVVLHDGGGSRTNTVAAMPTVIEGLKARGYEFVKLCT